MNILVQEKRHAARYEFALPAVVAMASGGQVRARLKNISRRSAYFAAPLQPEPAAAVSIRFILGKMPVAAGFALPELRGSVIRSDAGGFAVELRGRTTIPFECLGVFCDLFAPVSPPAVAW